MTRRPLEPSAMADLSKRRAREPGGACLWKAVNIYGAQGGVLLVEVGDDLSDAGHMDYPADHLLL